MPDDKDNPIQTHSPLKHDFGEVVFADSSGEIERPSHVPSTIFKAPDVKKNNYDAIPFVLIFVASIILVCSVIFFMKQKEAKNIQVNIDSTQIALEKVQSETKKLSTEIEASKSVVKSGATKDALRSDSVKKIALSLEIYYAETRASNRGVGAYPDAAVFKPAWITQNLVSVDAKSFTAPDGSFIAVPSTKTGSITNTAVPSSWVPQPSKGQYVYEPRNVSGEVCAAGEKCTSFKIWYKTEVDDKLKVVESDNKANQ